jgi:hypothetical protein
MTANLDPANAHPGATTMRVLVAFEDVRALYRHVFASAIRDLRPALNVRLASLGGLAHELGRFDPHVVVCSRPNDEHPSARGAWVHIPTEDGVQGDGRLAEICLEGERWRTDGPPLSELLAVIDETQQRLRERGLSEAC